MLNWTQTELAHGTIWLEARVENIELWLEWNDRVMAYRFGVVRNGQPASSSLGFADSLEAAKLLVVEQLRLEQF
jgi:hypothetical protein